MYHRCEKWKSNLLCMRCVLFLAFLRRYTENRILRLFKWHLQSEGGRRKGVFVSKNLLKMSKPQKCNLTNFTLFIFISSWNYETEWTISTIECNLNFCIHYSLTHLNCFSFELWRREKNWFGWILYLLTLCWHIFKVQFFPNCNFSFVRRS
jgi:hypothetical protein